MAVAAEGAWLMGAGGASDGQRDGSRVISESRGGGYVGDFFIFLVWEFSGGCASLVRCSIGLTTGGSGARRCAVSNGQGAKTWLLGLRWW